MLANSLSKHAQTLFHLHIRKSRIAPKQHMLTVLLLSLGNGVAGLQGVMTPPPTEAVSPYGSWTQPYPSNTAINNTGNMPMNARLLAPKQTGQVRAQKMPLQQPRKLPPMVLGINPCTGLICISGPAKQPAQPTTMPAQPNITQPNITQPNRNAMKQLMMSGAANNKELEEIAQSHTNILVKFFEENPDAHRYFMQIMNSYGIARADPLNILGLTGLPQPKVLISTVEEALALFTRFKKFMRDLLEKVKEYKGKGYAILEEKIRQLDRLQKEIKENRDELDTNNSLLVESELEKSLVLMRERSKELISEFHQIAKWLIDLVDGIRVTL